MSVESPYQNQSEPRRIRDDEKALLASLLSNLKNFSLVEERIAGVMVNDPTDGGMGSVKFHTSDARTLGLTLVEAEYLDADGVLVLIAVNADDRGDLYEVDFWKTDFSRLKQYSRAELVKIKCCRNPELAEQPLRPLIGTKSFNMPNITEADYIELVDLTGRDWHAGKRGKIADAEPKALTKLGLDKNHWTMRVKGIGSGYWRVVGELDELIDKAKEISQRTLFGIGLARFLNRV
jgi:hypothetical protein